MTRAKERRTIAVVARDRGTDPDVALAREIASAFATFADVLEGKVDVVGADDQATARYIEGVRAKVRSAALAVRGLRDLDGEIRAFLVALVVPLGRHLDTRDAERGTAPLSALGHALDVVGFAAAAADHALRSWVGADLHTLDHDEIVRRAARAIVACQKKRTRGRGMPEKWDALNELAQGFGVALSSGEALRDELRKRDR